jgi:hypothetical protein
MTAAKSLASICLSSLAVAAFATGCGGADQPADTTVSDGVLSPEAKPEALPEQANPNAISWTKDEQKNRNASSRLGGSSALMTYHGGKILTTAVTTAIFWGKSWGADAGANDKITGLDAFYTGYSGSNYAQTVNEYKGSNGQVGSTTTYVGHVVDTTTATGGSSALAILNEVCKQIAAGNISLDAYGNGYYPVYTDVPRGTAKYCAWHSSGTCGIKSDAGIPDGGSSNPVVQFAFFFNLDGDPGCDPQDTQTGHSQGLAALANVSAHELSEARSDPTSPGAWYDQQGQENGDKCAWTFNVPYVTFPDGNEWKLQGEWSNAAYGADGGSTGYPNLNGQKGCLDGH